jgi:hypothetical protein
MIHELNESERINIEDSWEGKSGIQVEDVITRNTISSIDYDQSSEILSLIRVDGTKLTTRVSAIEPSYIYDIIVYGIRIDNGTTHNAETLLMQYREGRRIEVGIAIKSVADRTGT